MLPDMGRLQPQARELEEAVLGGFKPLYTFEFPLAIFDCGVIILASRECVKKYPAHGHDTKLT